MKKRFVIAISLAVSASAIFSIMLSGCSKPEVQVKQTAAKTFRANPQHTGTFQSKGVSEFHRVKWKFKTGGEVKTSPTVVEGVAYFGSGDRYFYAVDAGTGKELWRFKTGKAKPTPFYQVDRENNDKEFGKSSSRRRRILVYRNESGVYSSAAFYNGLVYFGSNDGNLYALDAKTGIENWKFKTGAKVISSPSIVDNIAYFSSGDGKLYALDAASGKKKWAFEIVERGKAPCIASPAVVNGTVFVGGGERLHAVDAETGETKWDFETKGISMLSSPAVSGGVVYFGSDDGNLYALDASTGKKKWSYKAEEMVLSSPAVAGGLVYFGGTDGYLYALEAGTGKAKWVIKTGNSVGSPSIAEGIVYFGDNDGRFYAADAKTGQTQWSYRTKGMVQSSPTILDGTVYFGSTDNYLYALD